MAASTPVFNSSFTMSFSVPDGVSELTGLELVASRLFSQKPSENIIEDDTDVSDPNYVSGSRVTSWTDGDSDGEKILSFAEIPDPTPHDIGHETYYRVTNYLLESGATETYECIPFTVQRPGSLQSRLYASATDIKQRESKIGEIESDTWINNHITHASEDFVRRLRNRVWERKKVMEGDYNQAFTYFVLMRCCYDLTAERGDRWEVAGDRWQAAYEMAYSNDEIRVDVDGDDHIEEDERSGFGIKFLIT